MSAALAGLLAAVTAVNAVFGWKWISTLRREPGSARPGPIDLLIGFITDFFDTLGIGSFATTIALFKFRRRPADDLIPGTLNAGHTPAAFVETLIFVTTVSVDPILLVSMVASASAGVWLGAGVVTRMPVRTIQVLMGAALLLGALLYAMANLGLFPAGGTATSLEGWAFTIAVTGNFVFGALMAVGIGLYAPCMIMLALLGLHPLAAFPIMMASCALVQPVAGMRFLTRNRIAWSAATGLAIGGVIGVLVAAFVVKQLSLEALRWLAATVVAYAAITMLRSAARKPVVTG